MGLPDVEAEGSYCISPLDLESQDIERGGIYANSRALQVTSSFHQRRQCITLRKLHLLAPIQHGRVVVPARICDGITAAGHEALEPRAVGFNLSDHLRR